MPLLTRQQAADYLGVKIGTIYTWTWLGRLKPAQGRGRWARFSKRDLEKMRG